MTDCIRPLCHQCPEVTGFCAWKVETLAREIIRRWPREERRDVLVRLHKTSKETALLVWDEMRRQVGEDVIERRGR